MIKRTRLILQNGRWIPLPSPDSTLIRRPGSTRPPLHYEPLPTSPSNSKRPMYMARPIEVVSPVVIPDVKIKKEEKAKVILGVELPIKPQPPGEGGEMMY